MLTTKITTHVIDCLNRLMEQYKNQPNFAAILTAFVDQIQDLENAIFDLDAGRQLYNAVGVQLDQLGTLVGISRNGLDDAQYLLFILGKIGENFSDGTISRTTAIYQILLNATQAMEQDLYPAGAGFAAGGTIDQSLVGIVWNMVQQSLGAGIRLEFLETFDPNEAFAFDGDPAHTLGWGDATDASVGGKFATLLDPNFEFAFSSGDDTDGFYGWGDIRDPLVGGEFQSS